MTALEWSTIKYFRPKEFDSPDAPGSGEQMRWAFVWALDKLRAAWGRPLIVNSGWRTERHNTLVGGVKNSAHRRGWAADLHCSGLDEAVRLGLLAAMLGFRRVGVSLKGTVVHLDMDPALPTPAIWTYPQTVEAPI